VFDPQERLPETRDGFRFRGGHVALDLAATLAARLRLEPRELLAAPADLARWLAAAGLAAPGLAVTDADLHAARALREAIYALAGAAAAGAPLPAEAVAALNAAAESPAAIPRLEGRGALVLLGNAGALLATIAREAVLLLGGASAGRIRQCQSPTCPLLFLDTSRKGDRRWCSMAGCGNKAKAASFRKRHAAGEA
jgi:predicted RNA-binding Zn ribbon-like protein